MYQNLLFLAVIIALLALFIRALIKGSAIINFIGTFIDDTLKVNGKYAKHCVITATAWTTVLVSFFYDLVVNGFNESAWLALLGVGVGNKLVNAYSKKVDPLVVPPTPETK